MLLAELDGTLVGSSSAMPWDLAPLFQSVWAQRTYGGPPAIGTPAETPLPDDSALFPLGAEDGLVGAVLVTELNIVQRRAQVHVVTYEPRPRYARHAVRGMVVVGAVLGDSWGIERFWTLVNPEDPGPKLAQLMGFELEGRMRDHVLRPGGRGDMLVLGGTWGRLRELHSSKLSRIRWAAPPRVSDG